MHFYLFSKSFLKKIMGYYGAEKKYLYFIESDKMLF